MLIINPILGGTAMELSWTSEEGVSYDVQTNSNLILESGWQTFMTEPGDGGIVTVTNTVGPSATFYQVISN